MFPSFQYLLCCFMSFHDLTHGHKNFSFTSSALSKSAMRWLCALNLLHLAHLRHVFAAPGGNKAYQIRQDAVQKLFDPMTEVVFLYLDVRCFCWFQKNVWSRLKNQPVTIEIQHH